MRDCFYSFPGISLEVNLLQVQCHTGYHVVISASCLEEQYIGRCVEKKPGRFLPSRGGGTCQLRSGYDLTGFTGFKLESEEV